MANGNGFREGTVKIFCSYSTINKEIAGRLKQELEGFGFSVFLAHEDIAPCEKWEQVIAEKLSESDALMALLTKEYKESDWADQEVGMAVTQDKKIIPIQIDLIPYGFIKKYQAFKMTPERIPYNIPEIASQIFEAIKRDEKFRGQLLNSLIKAFDKSWSFEDASEKAERLLTFNDFTDDQVGEVAFIAVEKRCVRDSFRGKPFVIAFLKKYRKQIPPQYLENLKRIYGI
ncbi:MAG: toll/interleukin-1 receptor domain-containing protein [archaeon]